MRLAIADPPYLGRSHWYHSHGHRTGFRSNGTMNQPADHNEESLEWNDPARHARLVAELFAGWDSWAVAMARDSLPVYLAAAPRERIAVWHNPAAWPPGGGRIHATWEPVMLHVHPDRRGAVGMHRPKDVLIATPPRQLGFIGAKPRAWTRWVLDMLGYDQAQDTVDDLFPGSGAVTDEIRQQVIEL